MNRFSEKDWKLFRSKIADWQEAYMEKLNGEYIELLSGEGDASEKFWTLEKRIRQDKKDCGVQCDKEDVYDKFEEVKQVLQKDYEENKKPSGECIRMFVDTYGLCLPNDVLFDMSSLFELF